MSLKNIETETEVIINRRQYITFRTNGEASSKRVVMNKNLTQSFLNNLDCFLVPSLLRFETVDCTNNHGDVLIKIGQEVKTLSCLGFGFNQSWFLLVNLKMNVSSFHVVFH